MPQSVKLLAAQDKVRSFRGKADTINASGAEIGLAVFREWIPFADSVVGRLAAYQEDII